MDVAVNYPDDGPGTGPTTSHATTDQGTGETFSANSSGLLAVTGAGDASHPQHRLRP